MGKPSNPVLTALIPAAISIWLAGCAGSPRIAGSPGPIQRHHDAMGREKIKKALVKSASPKPVTGFGSSGFSDGHGISPYFTRADQLPAKIALVAFYVYDPGTVKSDKVGGWLYTTTTWVSEKKGNVLANKFLQTAIGPMKQAFERQGVQLLTLEEALAGEGKEEFYYRGVSTELSKGLMGGIRKFAMGLESGHKQMIIGADGYRVFDVAASWDWKRAIALGHDLSGALGTDAVLSVGLGLTRGGDVVTLNEIKWAVNGKNRIPKQEGKKYVSQNLGTGYYEGQCYVKMELPLHGKKGGIPFLNQKTKEENFEGFDLLMTALVEATGEIFSQAVAKNSK